MMNSGDPIVTVIIPTYNWSSVLRFAIDSVLWQSLENFELLVVGDGCTDDSAEVVAAFGDPRIRWNNLPENSGNQSAPNNAGIEMARGRYIAYLGHDDIWLPDHLAIHVETIEKTGADFTYSWLEMIGPEPACIRRVSGITASGEYEPDTVLPPSSVMHRRTVIESIGAWSDYRTIPGPPDQEFFARIFQSGKIIRPVGRLTVLKFNASWRPGCYVEKPFHQQEEYVQKIRRNPEFLSSELHTLVGSLVRAHPEEMTKNLLLPEHSRPGRLVEHAREVRGLDSRPLAPQRMPEIFPPFKDRIDLTSHDADPHLFSGWSWPEAPFRWTDGHEATLIFSLEPISALEMRLLLAPFLAPKSLKAQRVEISCNGRKLARLKVVKPGLETHEFRLGKGILRENNLIVFRLLDAAMPMSFGQSLDSRELGLRVGWIEFNRI